MLALSCNEILMDDLSELGPTDPQLGVNNRYNPAGAILKQFELGKTSLAADPSQIAAWLPILQMYGPALLVECQHHLDLSKELVKKWLEAYMFDGDPDAVAKAEEIASWLSIDDNFHTHSRRVSLDMLAEKRAKVVDMRADARLRDAIREAYYAIMWTFSFSGTYKLLESEHDIVALGFAVTAAPTGTASCRPVTRRSTKAERRRRR